MAKIKDQMADAIKKEIDVTVMADRQKLIVNYEKAKAVAEVVADLSTYADDAESLTNQYMAAIKRICEKS